MVDTHTHNGTDSQKLTGEAIENAPANALTTGTTSTASATYTAIEQGMINNLKTRVAEIEDALQLLGLLK